jgi:ribosomal protein L35
MRRLRQRRSIQQIKVTVLFVARILVHGKLTIEFAKCPGLSESAMYAASNKAAAVRVRAMESLQIVAESSGERHAAREMSPGRKGPRVTHTDAAEHKSLVSINENASARRSAPSRSLRRND